MWQKEVSLTHKNTLKFDSYTKWYSNPVSVENLLDDLLLVKKKGLSHRVLGQGSNVILQPFYAGLTLTPRMQTLNVAAHKNAYLVYAGAGLDWPQLVAWCCQQGLHGLENLAMIPGSVGAAPVQNISAYGLELVERLVAVDIVRPKNNTVSRIAVQDCQFGYRSSGFKTGDLQGVICGIILGLDKNLLCLQHKEVTQTVYASTEYQKTAKVTAKMIFQAVCSLRTAKLPNVNTEPNAGSFFLNPVISHEHFQKLRKSYHNLPGFCLADGRVKVPAAKLVELCGWKGRRLGLFKVFEHHALIFVNMGGGNNKGILELAKAVISDVQKLFAIELEIEPQVL